MRAEKQIGEALERVARWYARRCWWADPEDLLQEAWLVALGCNRDDLTDDQFVGYVHNAAARHLRRYCWRWSRPVSANKPEEQLAETSRTSFDDAPESLFVDSQDPELELMAREAEMLLPRWRSLLRTQLEWLCEHDTELPPKAAAAALCVLLDGTKPARAAAEVQVPIEMVYYGIDRVKIRAQDDYSCRLISAMLQDVQGGADG